MGLFKTQQSKNLFLAVLCILFILGIVVVLIFIPWHGQSPGESSKARQKLDRIIIPSP